MDARQKADLDRYITGNYGEDQMSEDDINEARLDMEDDLARDASGDARPEPEADLPVPLCTCNSPHITVHASWCEQYEFWNL